jgi:hypothetical protein
MMLLPRDILLEKEMNSGGKVSRGFPEESPSLTKAGDVQETQRGCANIDAALLSFTF